MPEIALIKMVETMDGDCSISDTPDGEPVLLLSEAATREVCRSLDVLLDSILPHNPDKQEAVGYVYDDIMDTFAFGRGSYLVLTSKPLSILTEALDRRTPENQAAFEAVVEELQEYLAERPDTAP